MKLNIYKNQKEIEKTYEVDEYDIMYGTIQDILSVLDDGLDNLKDNDQLIKLVTKNRSKLEDLLLDIFSAEGLTEEELRIVKPIIEHNDFNNIEEKTDNPNILRVLEYYCITKEETERARANSE